MKRSIFAIMFSLVIALLLTACAPADNFIPPSESNIVPAPGTPPAPADFEIAEIPVDDWFFDASPAEMFAPEAPAADFAPPTIEAPVAVDIGIIPPPDTVEHSVMLPLITPASASNRQMVYTVDVQLQTTDFMGGIGLLVSAVTELGGFVESAHVQGRDVRTPDVERIASHVFRIHSDSLAHFIVVMENNFNLLSMFQQSTDVTEPHAQGASVLDDLREREAEILSERNEILEMLNDAEILEPLYAEDIDLLHSTVRDLDSELRDVRANIRDMERRQATLDDTIHYSTVVVTLIEAVYVAEAPPIGFGERMGDATASGLEGLINALQGLLIFVIRAIPVLVILALIGVPAFIVTRKILRKTESRRIGKKVALEKARADAAAQYYGQQV